MEHKVSLPCPKKPMAGQNPEKDYSYIKVAMCISKEKYIISPAITSINTKYEAEIWANLYTSAYVKS
jgi:hypothetical protein